LAEHCGSGCIPATGEQNLEPCTLDGDGGGAPSEGDCLLAITNDASGTLEGVCAETGQGEAGAPCLTASNCGAGMGCVGTPGTCRAYCCGDVEACAAGTYCALRDLASQEVVNVSNPPQIPVCELADHCTLFEPCQNPELTCSVVRQDGATSCVPKGNGQSGEACPCKAGFMCNTALNECQQLCSVNGDECPVGSYCQSSTNLPQDFGICDSY
jgi:hypothetical protein